MSRFRELVTEIHRRSIWQVLGVYTLASWAMSGDVAAAEQTLERWRPERSGDFESPDERAKWQDADAELQPRVGAARRGLARLSRER